MIARYTRPEIGAVWTDQSRMEAWRRVEVAACEEMQGPTGSDLEAIRSATFTVEAVNEREKVTDHDMAAFVDVLSASAGPGGRWIHFGLTSSTSVAGGLDALLAIVQMPPGVPVACVGVDNARNAAVLAARILSL